MRAGFCIVVLAVGISCSGGAKPAALAPAPAPVVAQPAVVTPPKETQPIIPDTPAGQALRAWFDAFNSGDEQRLQAFVTQYKSEQSAADWLGFHKDTGGAGFVLLGIEKSEQLAVRFLVKEKAGTTRAVGWLRVKDDGGLASLQLLAIPPGLTAADMDMNIDAAARARVIDAAIAKLTEHYIFPDVAKKMDQALRAHQKAGAYDAITDATAFARVLTEELQAVSKDKHLRVNFIAQKLPELDAEPSAEDKARMREQLEKINCGFEKAETLDGNLGYVKFNMFAEVELCGAKATAALASLGDVDALIFDLRDNGGGQPEMVAFITSYLFAKRTHLNDLYERKENKTTQYWTKPEVPGTKFAKQPVYVLTSSRTFSGAEEFSYNLKTLKRATIIGEVTGGGAHPTAGKRLDDHFMIGVPFARAINPITKTNWEGKGVEPDVKVPADQALETAKKLAAERLAKKPRK